MFRSNSKGYIFFLLTNTKRTIGSLYLHIAHYYCFGDFQSSNLIFKTVGNIQIQNIKSQDRHLTGKHNYGDFRIRSVMIVWGLWRDFWHTLTHISGKVTTLNSVYCCCLSSAILQTETIWKLKSECYHLASGTGTFKWKLKVFIFNIKEKES